MLFFTTNYFSVQTFSVFFLSSIFVKIRLILLFSKLSSIELYYWSGRTKNMILWTGLFLLMNTNLMSFSFLFLYRKKPLLSWVRTSQVFAVQFAYGKAILLLWACFLCNTELRITNTEACRFHSAYRVSWSFACAELALWGLNGACSPWHDMSWAFCLCTLPCLRWAGSVRGGCSKWQCVQLWSRKVRRCLFQMSFNS